MKESKEVFIEKGKKVEDVFASLFTNAKRSAHEDDIYEHWDISIESKIDVKMMKRKHRSGDYDENIHWLEIKGITGYPGWVYREADFFAFETENYFVIVEKKKLQDWIKENVKKEFVNQPTLYKLYRRKDKKDLVVLVKTLDLCYISSRIIKKYATT